MQIQKNIDTWVFDLDNTLYSADSGIFQQVSMLMGKFVAKHLKINIKKAKELQRKYYKQHGTTLRGLMDNHGVDPDYFLEDSIKYFLKNETKQKNSSINFVITLISTLFVGYFFMQVYQLIISLKITY